MIEPRIGVIGCGKMGAYHLTNWIQIQGVRLVGVVDPRAEAAENASKRFCCRRYPDVASLLEDVDAVSIAAPSVAHAALVLQCRDAGVHALVEKPLCLTSEDAYRLAASFSKGGPLLQVGHVERYNPTFRALREAIDGEEVFSYRFYRLHPFQTPREPISVIFDLMIHDLDLLGMLEGQCDIEAAAGEAVRTDTFDQAIAMARFGKLGTAHFLTSRVAQTRRRMIVANTRRAEYRADLLRGRLTIHPWNVANGGTGRVKHYKLPSANPLREELADFARSITLSEPTTVSAAEGARAVRLAEEVQELSGEFVRGASRLSLGSTGDFRELARAAGGVFGSTELLEAGSELES